MVACKAPCLTPTQMVHRPEAGRRRRAGGAATALQDDTAPCQGIDRARHGALRATPRPKPKPKPICHNASFAAPLPPGLPCLERRELEPRALDDIHAGAPLDGEVGRLAARRAGGIACVCMRARARARVCMGTGGGSQHAAQERGRGMWERGGEGKHALDGVFCRQRRGAGLPTWPWEQELWGGRQAHRLLQAPHQSGAGTQRRGMQACAKGRIISSARHAQATPYPPADARTHIHTQTRMPARAGKHLPVRKKPSASNASAVAAGRPQYC